MKGEPNRTNLIRFAASSVVAIVTVFIVVLLIAVADLYLTGHGYASIGRPVVLSMSVADIVLLSSGAAAWAITWRAMGKAGGRSIRPRS